MSPQTPPTDKKFARDVAVQLDKVTRRRRRVRRLLLLALLAAAIALAIMYLTCGYGFGLGGKGKGDGDGTGSGSVQTLVSPDGPPARCAVRVAAAGITVDGAKVTKEQAVTTCKARPGADITVTGGANQGAFDELRAAFVEAKIPFTILDASSGGRGSGLSGSGSGSAR
jgi:hypothetical protein